MAEGDLDTYKRVWQVWDVTFVFPLHTLNNQCTGRKKCDFYLNYANRTARTVHSMTTAYLIGLEIEMRITTDYYMHVLLMNFHLVRALCDTSSLGECTERDNTA